jgi:twitching motility protein PilI
VPLTKPWFAGLANIRGNLYSVVDLAAFVGKEVTPRNSSSRLLLIGTRHGSNAALLVNRMIGLRNVDALTPEPATDDAPAWAPELYADNEGRRWKKLKVRELLADENFMDIAA